MGAKRIVGVLASSTYLLGVAACTGMGQGGSQTTLMKAAGSEATASEFRAGTHDLAIRIPGLIEQTGDRVLSQTLDPELRRRALLWKLEGSAAFQQALLRPDPLAATIETWALAIQIEDTVETGELRGAFGSLQPIVQEGARAVRSAIDVESQAIARKPEGHAKARDFVTGWAHEHPITLPFSARPTIQPLLARMASSKELGLVEAFGGATASFEDFNTRVDIYAAFAPKSARWQAELAALDAARSDTGRLALAALQSAQGVLSRADSLLSADGVKQLSGAAVTSLRGERVAVLGDLDRQRIDAFDRLGKERQAVLGNVEGQRLATLADLDAKLIRGLDGAEALRARTMTDLEAVANRLLFRMGLVVAVLMALGALLVWLVLRSGVFRRPPPTA
jgi:hypothetical protein